ncbi:hypothetical protein DMENIID0001_108080 [Sergentomyia squamirostris]
MPSCPPALRCFLPSAFRGNFDKNRVVPVSEFPAEYGAYRSTLTTGGNITPTNTKPSKINGGQLKKPAAR